MLEIDECVRRRGFNAQTDWTTFVFNKGHTCCDLYDNVMKEQRGSC